VDGNDVVAVHEAVVTAAERARAGDGPSLIEAETYRHYGHSRTDPGKYRPEDEVAHWLERDPLRVTRDRLSGLGVDHGTLEAAEARATHRVRAAVDEAMSAPAADPTEAFTDVWADGSATWRS
jgi:pyruvate dehydrogenase E1 component alpha subunit